jgi:hypothetical protein
MAGCTRCACAATSSCKEADLVGAACGACRAPGTDLCARVRWQLLIMPYTGLIEAVLLAVPGFISLLLLVQRISGGSSSTVADSGYGRALMGGGGGGNDVKCVRACCGRAACAGRLQLVAAVHRNASAARLLPMLGLCPCSACNAAAGAMPCHAMPCRVMVSALGHSEAEDWPSTTPAVSDPGARR